MSSLPLLPVRGNKVKCNLTIPRKGATTRVITSVEEESVEPVVVDVTTGTLEVPEKGIPGLSVVLHNQDDNRGPVTVSFTCLFSQTNVSEQSVYGYVDTHSRVRTRALVWTRDHSGVSRLVPRE